MMKIGSFNIRGLGSVVKKDELCSFFEKSKFDICCVQETKMETFSDLEGLRIWKTRGISWCAEGAVGRSGGLLTFWDDQKFSCTSHWGIGGAVVVNGRWRATGEDFCIVNVYAPCNLRDKLLLWDRLSLIVRQREDVYTCLIGDFNSIIEVGERIGVGSSDSRRDRREFVDFLERCKLLDVHLLGRKFTCYSSGEPCKSRIDRALINELWASKWQETELSGLPRSVSDHCAIILTTKSEDWGPKPFRFINAWLSGPGFRERVEESWREEGITGGGASW